ncbi:MAG TPA: preprotein translocase subunit SecE [Firmicutes bacterium]|nr:preprotein translocase subunit SecE [Bacillota bacterium]
MGVKKYTSEVIKEGKRVRWPKKEKFFPVLISVIIICAFTALILSVEDWAAGTLIGQLKDLFSGLKSETSETTSAAINIFNWLHF